MSLISALKKDVLDETASLSSALRKVKVIAAEVGDEVLAYWVENELTGYATIEELPSYRSTQCHSYGKFLSIRAKTTRTLIPESAIRENWKEWATNFHLLQGIRELETLADADVSELKENWMPELAETLHDKVIVGGQCTSAWKALPKPTLVGILEAVRNRLLDFVLDLEKRFPELRISDERLSTLSAHDFGTSLQIIVEGSNNIIATNDSEIKNINQTSTVVAGDLGSLRQYLSGVGIDENDLDSLEEAITVDGPPSKPGEYGPNISAWVGDISSKAATGVYKVGFQVMISVIASGLTDFFL